MDRTAALGHAGDSGRGDRTDGGEILDGGEIWPPLLDRRIQGEVDQLLRQGFELLNDLTGKSHLSFDGLYQDWYTLAAPIVGKLSPSRLEEFRSLYRWPSRRRQDFETFGIRDYLLGMSLHGGYGGIDVTRGIVARRFHQQLLILKVARHELSTIISRMRIEMASELVLRQLDLADRRSRSGDNRSASLMIVAALETLIMELARHCAGAGQAKSLGKVVEKLVASKIVEPEIAFEMSEASKKMTLIAKSGGYTDQDRLTGLIETSKRLVGQLQPA